MKKSMEITNITASYSRKLNHSIYGGVQYESSDHFCSLSADVEIGEDVLAAQKELASLCKTLIEKDIESEIVSFAGGVPPDDFYEYLRNLVARRPIDAETYERCSTRQKMILQAAKRGIQMRDRDVKKEVVAESPVPTAVAPTEPTDTIKVTKKRTKKTSHESK